MNKDAERICEINEAATKYYRALLWSDKGRRGMECLKEYNLSDETIKKFDIGYADGINESVFLHLKGLGYDENEIAECGIVSDKENTDLFRDRVVFPIKNKDKRIIAFSGKTAGNEQPIYLNTFNSLIEHEEILYGIEYALHSESAYFIVCEGYIDTMLLHQAGFDMSVGVFGMKSPMNYLYEIKKSLILTSDLLIYGRAMDGAAVRSYYKDRRTVKILDLSPYRDAAEFMIKAGKSAFEEKIRNSREFFIDF